jgi:ribosome biogenesis protein Nip4
MRFWKAGESEMKILRKLDSEFGIDIDKILAGRRIIVSERREVYVLSNEAYSAMREMKRDPYGAGLHIGKIKREKFDLGLEGAAMIAPHSRKTISVGKKYEQVVLYGGDVRSKSAIKKSGLADGDRCLIANEHKENIAIGRIEEDKIITVRDRGHYLRSGR